MGEQPTISPEELLEQKSKMQKVDDAEIKELEERRKERAAEIEKIKAAMEEAAKKEGGA